MADRRRVLLVATTTGYQTEQFRQAALALGVDLTLATDRCHQLPDPWGDQAIPVRFEPGKEVLRDALTAVRARGPFQGIAAVGDRAAVLAAQLAETLKLPFHSAAAAAVARNKFAFRQALSDAGLPTPWFRRFRLDADPRTAAGGLQFPCVLKPLMLSASRGVIRANNAAEFAAAFERVRRLLESPAIRQWKDPNADWILVEGFISGREFALDGWMAAGVLQRFVLFDKPDPLEGPFFEETVYLAPSRLEVEQRALIWDMVEAAARAAGLCSGPIHAEIRLDGSNAYVLEIAARSVGGYCGRVLRFTRPGQPQTVSLEQVLLRGALGEPLSAWQRETSAAGVMMIPIPGSGILEQVRGVAQAAAVPGIETVEITAKPGEPLQALPEGATYLGFIFSRSATPAAVEQALRTAHAKLQVEMRQALPVA
ncbi:MAG: ATP-grasp domain-containing protein [Terriglobales bacterium]